jgi:[1-hydroxy-2-(trimethylamino)ethyl]phosphonate dioxygenase
MPESIVDHIIRLFKERGDAAYVGEPVSQTEHALQAAFAAEKENASPSLIVAALLHDVGHILHNLPEDCADQGIDDRHEELGCRFLMRHFGPEVSEPVRLHVPAKRYLCAVEPDYLTSLSPASIRSLELQGGVFSAAETREFERHPHLRAAVAVRRWDDIAKVPELKTPDLEHFRPHLERVLICS